MSDKLQADLIGARLVHGSRMYQHNGEAYYNIIQNNLLVGQRSFKINNPADCLAAVVALGEKHGISICPSKWSEAWFFSICANNTHFDTYTEAVAAALLAIGENDE